MRQLFNNYLSCNNSCETFDHVVNFKSVGLCSVMLTLYEVDPSERKTKFLPEWGSSWSCAEISGYLYFIHICFVKANWGYVINERNVCMSTRLRNTLKIRLVIQQGIFEDLKYYLMWSVEGKMGCKLCLCALSVYSRYLIMHFKNGWTWEKHYKARTMSQIFSTQRINQSNSA